MGRGGYNGGGTIIGFGRRWSDWREFSRKKVVSGGRPPTKKIVATIVVDELPLTRDGPMVIVSAALRDADQRARKLKLTQYDLLRELGMSKASLRGPNRGAALRKLVEQGLLLATGLPNPDHPKVREIIKRVDSAT